MPTCYRFFLLPILSAVLALGIACGPDGSNPVMQQVADQLVAVNQELIIILNAGDKDGDEVFYSFQSSAPDIYARASLNRLPIGVAEFRWTPRASDVGEWFFDFSASDGNGKDTITIRIEVRGAIGGNSAPRFVHPQGSGTTLDLAVTDCLNLNVEVVDADSAQVKLGQADPVIEGAQFVQESGLAGQWSFCPSPEQIAADDRYTLLLSADDDDNPVKLHPYLVVLRSPLKEDCPGDPPIITHTPADIESLVGIKIKAQISDDKGLKQEPLLYYSTTAPSVPPDLSQMIQVIMAPDSGSISSTAWTAQLPNPVVNMPVGSSKNIYYTIIANDDDDAEGSCDHLSQAPTSGSFQMRVTNPGGNGGVGLCEPCTADVQCGGASDHCVAAGNGSGAFCMRSCTSACPSGYSCSSTALQSVDGASLAQCVPNSHDCSNLGGDQCVDDNLENNDSRSEAQAKPLLAAGVDHSLVSCPASSGVGDDEDWFEIYVGQEGQLSVNLSGSSQSDLDLALYRSDGSFVALSGNFSSTESITRCLPQGFYFIRVYAFGPVQNPYTLHYALTPQSCVSSTCQADVLEPDGNAAQATIVTLSQGPVEFTGQTLCTGDDDWYKLQLFDNQLLLVDLTFTQSGGGSDLDIHFFNSALVDQTPCSLTNVSSCALDNGQSGTSNESAIYEAPSSGCAPCTFYVVVRGFDDDENNYSIRLESD